MRKERGKIESSTSGVSSPEASGSGPRSLLAISSWEVAVETLWGARIGLDSGGELQAMAARKQESETAAKACVGVPLL